MTLAAPNGSNNNKLWETAMVNKTAHIGALIYDFISLQMKTNWATVKILLFFFICLFIH